MTETKRKKLLDKLPFIILCAQALVCFGVLLSTDLVFNWRHIVALAFLVANGLLFVRRHHLGVLFSGLMLLLGYFNGLSLSPSLMTITWGISPGGFYIPFFYGQPIYIILTFVHFSLSGKYYFGIITKKYWQAYAAGKEYSRDE